MRAHVRTSARRPQDSRNFVPGLTPSAVKNFLGWRVPVLSVSLLKIENECVRTNYYNVSQ